MDAKKLEEIKAAHEAAKGEMPACSVGLEAHRHRGMLLTLVDGAPSLDALTQARALLRRVRLRLGGHPKDGNAASSAHDVQMVDEIDAFLAGLPVPALAVGMRVIAKHDPTIDERLAVETGRARERCDGHGGRIELKMADGWQVDHGDYGRAWWTSAELTPDTAGHPTLRVEATDPADRWIAWRGSVSDLATDIRKALSSEQTYRLFCNLGEGKDAPRAWTEEQIREAYHTCAPKPREEMVDAMLRVRGEP